MSPVNAFRGGSNAEIQFWIGDPDLAQARVPAAKGTVALRDVVTLEDGTGRGPTG